MFNALASSVKSPSSYGHLPENFFPIVAAAVVVVVVVVVAGANSPFL